MARSAARVLVVGPESDGRRTLVAALRDHGHEVAWAHDGESALNVLGRERVDALVCELRERRVDGFAVLEQARRHRPDVCAILLTDGPDLEAAIEAMRLGAWDVLARPVPPPRVIEALRRGLEHQALTERVAEMEDQLERRFGLDALAGRSRAIQRVRDQIRQVAPTRATVLIEGERGTGKSLLARTLHHSSPRRDRPFVVVRCPALSPELQELELFGAPAAAGGPRARPGAFERASGGTLFLDAVDALGAAQQAALLRVLQERAVLRPGDPEPHRVDVRLIASSERDLASEAKAGRFREDLFYLLSVVRVALPPLRERREDLPELVHELLRALAREHGRRPRAMTSGALERLAAHDWPGNASELKSVLEGMVVSARGRAPLDVSALPERLREADAAVRPLPLEVGMTIAEAERLLLEATMRHTGGDKPRAARMLGIGLRTLYRKLDDLPRPRPRARRRLR